HSLALIATGLIAARLPAPAAAGRASPLLVAAAWCFLAGIVVFAGTVYALALGAPRWLGAVTPLGGVAFIAGWILVAIAVLRTTYRETQ
ncbi:MAG TPA: DUF423 domain-containing protein, partial [Longimicrobiales bacterium]|nr:DUF423 domain-containing protein [Longimicrobiales bacterium]